MNQQLLNNLEKRIGFGKPYNLPNNINVDQEHIEGESGRTFKYFHQLVILENIYQTVQKIGMSSEEFNDYLMQMKKDVALSILDFVHFEISEDCRKVINLSGILSDNQSLLDEVYGYKLAATAIELMISSNRVNRDERNAVFKYEKLKVELEGWQDPNGRTITLGLNAKINNSMRKLISNLCPKKELIIEDAKAW